MSIKQLSILITFCLTAMTLAGQTIQNGVLLIPEGTAEIKNKAYYGNEEIKKVIIAGSVKKIGNKAFAGCKNLEEVVCKEGVEKIEVNAFYDCPKLNSVALPISVTEIVPDGLYKQNKETRVFHCYAGSQAYNLAVENGYKKIDIVGIDEEHKDTIDLKYAALGGNKTVKAGLFRDFPIEKIDLGNDIVEIGKNAFNDKSLIRVKKGTGGDKYLKENGWYLCGILADLNTYTKDKSKEIKEDFTRILCDDERFVNWTAYNFKIQEPLKLEEVDEKLVLTSFMFYPCKNVTVTDKNGKALISKKTIQPLTRTVLCDFDFLTDDVNNYKLTSDDKLYKKLVSIQTKWNISFSDFVRRASTSKDNFITSMKPVFVREYIGGIFNAAYIIGSDEYEKRCYEAVKNKELVTDQALTVPLTKEQMDKLLRQARNWSLTLGRDTIAGTGGGNWLSMTTDFILTFDEGGGGAFWHEFSHCMGWGHNHGNMCNGEVAKPYGPNSWQIIGGSVYKEEFKKGNTPYTEKNIFNTKFFSSDELHPPKYIDDDVVKDGILYVTEGMPYVDSHKKQTDFTKVVIPDSVEVIKNSAFYDTKLTEITIPPNVTKIDDSAFCGCLSLKNIDIPDTVKTVGDGAFENCTSLTKVRIGSGMRQLNKKMFKNAALTEITIPKNIKYIANDAFQNCRNLTKVMIEDGVRWIGDNAFGGTALTEITIPQSVTMIGKNITSKNVIWNVKEGSYAYTFAIENKILVGTLADKGRMILAECDNAESAPNDVWNNGVFSKEDTRRKWDFSDKLSGTDGGRYSVRFVYTNGTDTLRLTDTLFTADGKAIGYFAEMRSVGSNQRETVYEIMVPKNTKKLEMFALARAGKSDISGTITVNNMALKKLVIPEGTASIKDEAYFGCKFEEVVFPSGLTKIGRMAFLDSTELKSVTIPDSIADIGISAFQNCPSLSAAKLGSGLKKLSTKLFKASGLTKITISDNIETIEDEVFRDCEELKNVTIDNGVRKIGKKVFTGSKKLAEIVIPDSVTDIGDAAFESCTSLTNAKIGSGLKILGYRMFMNSGLTKITIPANVDTIGEQAFQECANLKNVTIENGVRTIGNKAFKKSALTNITIPKTVNNIEYEAFKECETLASVTFTNGVKNIGEKAFEGTALTEVKIPASVEVIGVKSFQNCKSLENVTIDNGVKEIGEKAFSGTAIKEIKIPASITAIGKDILPKKTVWDVEVGTYAYNYAFENKLQIKLTDAIIRDKAARLSANKKIAAAPSDKWEKGTFTKDDVTRKWDFSAYLSGDGKYTVRFKYTGGAHKLTLSDAIFTADGKLIAYFQESLSAGLNPKEIVYEIEVPKGTKKLLLYANAKAGGGDDSRGVIKVER